jgi:F420H(2)-dependent quinone reductase
MGKWQDSFRDRDEAVELVNFLGRIQLALSRLTSRHGLYLGRRSTRVHCAVYRLTRGRVGGRLPGFPEIRIVLVDHVGAKSGTRRTSPLMCVRNGEMVAVAASKAGQPTHPAWFHNLIAHPETTIQLGADVRAVRARVASDDERRDLWSQLTATFPGFEDYARTAAPRQIPIVVFELSR